MDDSAEWYVQALKPGLYYAWNIPSGARIGNLWFTTTKPAGSTLPVQVRVLTWRFPEGNIYDDTLGDVTLTAMDKGQLLLFSGTVVFPDAIRANMLGVELNSSLNHVAWRAQPHTGYACDVDFMGRGIGECGEWIEAAIQLWAQCRGLVGQLIPCHGQSYVLAPKIHTIGVRTEEVRMADDSNSELYPFYASPHLVLFAGRDGWRYRPARPGPPPDDDEIEPSYGPFATAEEAARDAAARLDLPRDTWLEVAEMAGSESDIGRAAMVLHSLLGQ